MEVTLIFTNVLKTQTRTLLDDSAGGSMKNKIAAEIKELIENMSLNEYRPQDALLGSHKLLSDKIEAIAKKLEEEEVARLSTNDIGHVFCEQAHETKACLLASLRLYEEQC